MLPYGRTTVFAPILSTDPILTGEEVFKFSGPKFRQIKDGSIAEIAERIRSNRLEIMRNMKGLRRRWSCLEKAILVRRFIGSGVVAIGSMLVWNNERNGTYGYFYNPPLEFHAWLELDHTPFIVDFALPGVIEKGLETKDEYGAILKNIRPVILCGPAPEWLDYKAHEHFEGDALKELAAKYSLDID